MVYLVPYRVALVTDEGEFGAVFCCWNKHARDWRGGGGGCCHCLAPHRGGSRAHSGPYSDTLRHTWADTSQWDRRICLSIHSSRRRRMHTWRHCWRHRKCHHQWTPAMYSRPQGWDYIRKRSHHTTPATLKLSCIKGKNTLFDALIDEDS